MPPLTAHIPASVLLPLPEDKQAQLKQLLEGLDTGALWWLSGYTAGIATARRADAADRGNPEPGASRASAVEAQKDARLSIVYGSQTGNSKRLAEQLAAQASADGLNVRLLRAENYPLRELKDERLLYVVISTHGDGDPPDDARAFVEHVLGKRAPELKRLRFAVLGLGDSSYPQFCAVARRLDQRFAELGGQRVAPLAEADVDIERVSNPWLTQALAHAREHARAASPQHAATLASITPLRPLGANSPWSRERPFLAEVLANQRLTGRGSAKDVRHIELSLEGSGLSYQPGDSLGVWPSNAPERVTAILRELGLDADQLVSFEGEQHRLDHWLMERRELNKVSRPFLAKHAGRTETSSPLHALLGSEGSADLQQLLAGGTLLDVLRTYPTRTSARWSGEDLVASLRALSPRLYSLASSQRSVGPEAHLCVHHVTFQTASGDHWGVASRLLAHAEEGSRLPIFIEANERFRLPQDGSRNVIMIGPGTGVAPFRGFLQERVASGASGKHWLFFGNPHARTDFLYQLEWQRALKQGQLHRLDLAFSRDQAAKRYVQHALLEQGAELFDWLEQGASLYVCGDATRMAKDVESALLEVITRYQKRSGQDAGEAANEYLNALQRQGRYARDVY